MTEPIEKLPLSSMNIADDKLRQIKAAVPEAFAETGIDWALLRRALGEWLDPGKERFGLNWPGKADCMRTIQQPSVGTLLPMREESVNFDTTENLIIEGDNLEVLKLLQKSYYGKTKMIYIDPPYNTGNEFIYPDNFQEGLQDYLRYSGQVDAAGFKLSANTEADGRYHSKWLNMMYSRLYLSRNLLRDDGVIFVSIDDHEIANLTLLMNEIFGEENFRANISWKRKYAVSNNFKGIATVRDFILCYAKSDVFENGFFPRTEEDKSRYANPDNDPRGPWKSVDYWNQATPEQRPNLVYPITNPFSGQVINPTKKAWKYSKDTHEQHVRENRIWWGETGKNSVPALKLFLSDVRDGLIPDNVWDYKDAGHTDAAKKELDDLFGVAPFDTPKPTQLIKRILEVANVGDGDLVLDFFAGSGTTAHAIIDQNASDKKNRKYILVQLPEVIENPNYPTISAITRDRVRKALSKSEASHVPQLFDQENHRLDRGFKAFSLSTSNFKVWAGEADNLKDIPKTLELFANHVDENRRAEDILYELLLKAGFALTASVERLTLADKEVFSVSEGALLICLERELTLEVIESMVEKVPQMILCLDEGFKDNDQLKVNAVQTVKSRNQNDETDIVFRVV